MARDKPLAWLPDNITFSRDEAAELLGALDEGIALAVVGSEAHRAIRTAIRLVTAKLWPELGDVLDQEEG